jgi:hypothetical protein
MLIFEVIYHYSTVGGKNSIFFLNFQIIQFFLILIAFIDFVSWSIVYHEKLDICESV